MSGTVNLVSGSKQKTVVLSRSASDAVTGRQLSDAESGSEWETDVEDVPNVTDSQCQEKDEVEEDEMLPMETVVDVPSSSSYSSILKTTKQPEAEER